MRNLILFLMFSLCASCAISHGKPTAKIEYLGVERYLNRNIYQVRFSSDVDVDKLFKSKISQSLLCSLGEGMDFSQPRNLNQYGEGWIEPVAPADGTAFKADLMFRRVKDSSSDTLMSSEDLRTVLAGRQSIACKVRINSYSYKIYYSDVMNIPVADLLKEINKY